MADVDDMDRANAIVQWSIETGRDPFDTAGMDTDDEEWMGQNPMWHDYIQSEVIEKKKDKQVEKQKKKPAAKTAKKSTSKFNYPQEYLKKDGTLKKAYRKKAAQFRKEQTKTRSKSRSRSRSPRTPEPEPEPEPEWEPEPESDVEDIGLYDLPQEIDDRLFDELVFQGDTDRRMNIERCRRLREFCTLYPRTCAFDEDFKTRYVEPCVSRYNIRDVRGRKNQAYSEVMDYKGAINPQVRGQADIYSDRNRFFNRPDYHNIATYIKGIDRSVHNQSGSVFKKHGRDALLRSIDSASSRTYPNVTSMLKLKKDIMDNPLLLDEILGTFRINARKKGYGDKAINDMVRKFVDHLYLD